jgi:hypothetical protein
METTEKKLVITTIDFNAFQATGHVLPASYILDLSQEQIKFIEKLTNDGQTVDRVFISEQNT